MLWIALPLALLPAVLHWWWTRSVPERVASAVLAERHLAVAQRVSFVSMLCTVVVILTTGWQAVWILAVQFVALTATTYRWRRAIFGETWAFRHYLSWRFRFHTGMFGLWWFVAVAPVVVVQAGPAATWWLAGLAAAIALAWHHRSGGLLLWLLRASRLERPDLDDCFQRVFAAARVPQPDVWRAGTAGGMLANAFAMVTLRQRGVLFLDSLLEQLTADEITAILAHEVAHLEQFTPRRVLGMYLVTTVLIVLVMIGCSVASVLAPGFDSWVWVASVLGVCGAMWLRARHMQAHETDADLRAIELCGDPEALIRSLIRIYEINHIPRRWSAMAEEHATHPSLARRIRSIRARAAGTHTEPEPIARLVIASCEPGRCAVIDHNRVGFLWVTGELGDATTLLDRANRVEMIGYDQLSELRLSAKPGAIELVAVGRLARRWSMPIHETDAVRVQAALDRIDHLVIASSPASRDHGMSRRAAVLIAILFAAPYNAIGAVLAPALLALRRPKRPLMMALAAALGGTAIASVNDLDAGIVRVVLLTILTVVVVWSVRRPQQDEAEAPYWTWLERAGLLIPVLVGATFVAVNGRDLFGLHSAIRDRAWFTASLATMAVFFLVHTHQRTARRAGFGLAALATASLVVGSPWFLLHGVADPLVAAMPTFSEKAVPVMALAQRSVAGDFMSVQVTPDGNHFLLVGEPEESEYDDESSAALHRVHVVAGAFDGWSREIRAFDAAVIDDARLLILDRDRGSSVLRAEDMRSGRRLWTMTLETDISMVQAAPDGRWRAFARRGRQFERIDGRVGAAAVTSTRWDVDTDKESYLDMPRSDSSDVALAVASTWQEPPFTWMVYQWRETKRLLRVDNARTIEIATSQLRVECPAPPIDVVDSVCISFDGRWSRFWRVDFSSGKLHPIGETPRVMWKLWQQSQHRLVGISHGRPLLADLDSRTAIRLSTDQRCWTQDVGMSHDVVVATCSDAGTTTVMQYRLPASR